MQREHAPVLIVDDEADLIRFVKEVLETASIGSIGTQNGEEAAGIVKREGISTVVLDLQMAPIDGMEVLKRLRELERPPNVIMLTGFGTIDVATEAMKLGAFAFLSKPVDLERLIKAVRDSMLAFGSSDPWIHDKTGDRFSIIGANQHFLDTLDLLDKAAATHLPILLIGETGTGKELCARRIHLKSQRSDGKYLAVNCGNLPEHLVESELFGHEKGSFTGADSQAGGLYDAASGGTLFLDEVSSLSLPAQVALLRASETGEYRRVGGTETLHADVRIVAASPLPLTDYIEAGEFRDDLYYRLRGFEITLPPLRERLDDLSLLIQHFAGSKDVDLSEEAMSALAAHHWPGNMRELRMVIERAVALASRNTIQPQHLLLNRPATSRNVYRDLKTLEQINREYIAVVFHRLKGDIDQTAETLGLSRRTLYRKLQQYGITREIL